MTLHSETSLNIDFFLQLHKHNYNISEALKALVPSTGPMLCRDEMEDWSASEANLFEEAIEKYGKDFNDIKKDFLPWKSMRSIIEYFFMWKTTDRYVQQKRIKAMEAENKLKQVFVPAYTNKTTRLVCTLHHSQEISKFNLRPIGIKHATDLPHD